MPTHSRRVAGKRKGLPQSGPFPRHAVSRPVIAERALLLGYWCKGDLSPITENGYEPASRSYGAREIFQSSEGASQARKQIV